MNIPELKTIITQEKINCYARASGDFNPIHLDQAFARQTPAGGTIAHGMLILAYVSRVMTMAFGHSWLTSGRLDVRFKNPARPGDTVTATGKVRKETAGGDYKTVVCEIICINQRGEALISGEASVKLPIV